MNPLPSPTQAPKQSLAGDVGERCRICPYAKCRYNNKNYETSSVGRRIPKDKCPKVLAIWCEDGVCRLPSDPRPEPYPKGHALFLLENRTDFGPNRWDEYLDINKMQFRHMPGNHFSMIHGKLAKILTGFIQEALEP